MGEPHPQRGSAACLVLCAHWHVPAGEACPECVAHRLGTRAWIPDDVEEGACLA